VPRPGVQPWRDGGETDGGKSAPTLARTGRVGQRLDSGREGNGRLSDQMA